MIMIMNTNNIIKVNIHVFNKFTNKKEIVKVSVRANSVMELCEKLAGTVNGRNLHYLLARPELFNRTRCFFSCFTKAFKNYLEFEKEIGPCHRFEYDGISLDK
nr:MAG TPA: hypothetical protein [Ackermannviridae sp.]